MGLSNRMTPRIHQTERNYKRLRDYFYYHRRLKSASACHGSATCTIFFNYDTTQTAVSGRSKALLIHLHHQHQSGSTPTSSIIFTPRFKIRKNLIFERDEIDEDTYSWLGHHWNVYETI